MRECGLTYKQIGDRIGVGSARAKDLWAKAKRDIRTDHQEPVQMYMAGAWAAARELVPVPESESVAKANAEYEAG